ncbi:MAG: Catalyzes the cleavage of p-aminobenzoyl-glutamate to p-aminobenzoate and glutamate, subunit [Proteobacteria bacterium]|nr:Catalyzes the cleavage of p-aminobenzoyl-glutamate to p-aminobenzoate and glutamate, subunit [Pseudomonadota bacterium]
MTHLKLNTMIATEIAAFIDSSPDDFTALADRIWQFAEVGYAEHQSAAAQREILERHGFRVRSGLSGMATAFVAEAGEGGEADTVIAFLGEFDALPGLNQIAGQTTRESAGGGGEQGCGHGCGHHLLGTGALLAAIAAADYLKRHAIAATVRYYACPAEENGAGKAFLARDGHFDDVAAALTWHPGSSTGVMTGPTLANKQAYFRFSGRAAHAAAAPHLGRSALDAVELMNVGVNYLREHMIPEARVHYAITDAGGSAPNVVQASAEVLYLVRAPDAAAVEALYQRVCKIAQGATLMTETQVAIRVDKASAHMLHSQTLDGHLAEVIGRLGGPQFDEHDAQLAREMQSAMSRDDIAAAKRKFLIRADDDQPLSGEAMPYQPFHPSVGGSTDVADVSWVVPTTQCWSACYAIGTPAHSWQNVAQGKTAHAHKGMLHAAKVLAVTAIELISDPQRREAAQQELRDAQAVSERPNLLPDDVHAPQP